MHLLSLAYAEAADGASQLPLWAQNLGNSLLLLGTSPALHGFTRMTQRGLETLGLTSAWMGAAAVLLAACVTVWITRRQRLRSDDEGLEFLALYCALLLAAYSFVVFGQIFFARYYYPIFFVSILVACDTFEALQARTVGRRRTLLWAIAVVYVAFLPAMAWKRTRHKDYRFVNAVQWIEAATPREARVGVFNGGAIGYFSTRHVINLDGKVNHGALHALQEDRLQVYLRNERIDYVVDHERVLGRFLFSRPASAPLHFSRVASEDELGVPDWSAYRVTAQSPGGGSLGEATLDP